MVPVYNPGKALPRCLDSILCQSYPKFELLLCDDKSTYESLEILQQYARLDKRIRVICYEENRGSLMARNTLIRAASGEYSMWMDSDDEIVPDFLEFAVQKLKSSPCDIMEFPYKVIRNDGDSFLVSRLCKTLF